MRIMPVLLAAAFAAAFAPSPLPKHDGPVGCRKGSFEYIQTKLKAQGVVYQQLRGPINDKDEWHFQCAIPDPNNPLVRRIIEARAAGRHGLAAMEVVLKVIDPSAAD